MSLLQSFPMEYPCFAVNGRGMSHLYHTKAFIDIVLRQVIVQHIVVK